jgi:hypothetical protein
MRPIKTSIGFTSIADAKSAMQEAQQELKEAKAAYTEDGASEVALLEYLEAKLKTLNDNLAQFVKLYNDLVNQLQQQVIGIGIGG